MGDMGASKFVGIGSLTALSISWMVVYGLVSSVLGWSNLKGVCPDNPPLLSAGTISSVANRCPVAACPIFT